MVGASSIWQCAAVRLSALRVLSARSSFVRSLPTRYLRKCEHAKRPPARDHDCRVMVSNLK
eukprot:scaffold4869_cov123-Isochrysis_galbana.AAC.11